MYSYNPGKEEDGKDVEKSNMKIKCKWWVDDQDRTVSVVWVESTLDFWSDSGMSIDRTD